MNAWECENCGRFNHILDGVCRHCGHVEETSEPPEIEAKDTAPAHGVVGGDAPESK